MLLKLIICRGISGTCSKFGKPPLKAELRKIPRSCNPDFTRCRGAAPLEGHDDPVLGQDEDYPDWLWELADECLMTIDERLEKPNHALFRKIEHFRQNENKKIMRLRNKNPSLFADLAYPTEEEIIDIIRQSENARLSNIEDGQIFAEELRNKASLELRQGIHADKKSNPHESEPSELKINSANT